MDPVESELSVNETAPKKLFKVCDSNGSERKCVVAANFEELQSAIQRKFHLSVEFCVVLEEDDAEIDDECFPHLPQLSKLKFMSSGKRSKVEHSQSNGGQKAEHSRKLVVSEKARCVKGGDAVEVKAEPKVYELIDIADQEDDDDYKTNVNELYTAPVARNLRSSCRRLASQSTNSLTMFVKTPAGKEFPLRVNSSDTVKDVKEQLKANEGVDLPRQIFLPNGKQLENRRKISDYGILSGTTVHLI